MDNSCKTTVQCREMERVGRSGSLCGTLSPPRGPPAPCLQCHASTLCCPCLVLISMLLHPVYFSCSAGLDLNWGFIMFAGRIRPDLLNARFWAKVADLELRVFENKTLCPHVRVCGSPLNRCFRLQARVWPQTYAQKDADAFQLYSSYFSLLVDETSTL